MTHCQQRMLPPLMMQQHYQNKNACAGNNSPNSVLQPMMGSPYGFYPANYNYAAMFHNQPSNCKCQDGKSVCQPVEDPTCCVHNEKLYSLGETRLEPHGSRLIKCICLVGRMSSKWECFDPMMEMSQELSKTGSVTKTLENTNHAEANIRETDDFNEQINLTQEVSNWEPSQEKPTRTSVKLPNLPSGYQRIETFCQSRSNIKYQPGESWREIVNSKFNQIEQCHCYSDGTIACSEVKVQSKFSAAYTPEPEIIRLEDRTLCKVNKIVFKLGEIRRIEKDNLHCICEGFDSWNCLQGCRLDDRVFKVGEIQPKINKRTYEEVKALKDAGKDWTPVVKLCECQENSKWKCSETAKVEVQPEFAKPEPRQPIQTSEILPQPIPVSRPIKTIPVPKPKRKPNEPYPGAICFYGVSTKVDCQCPHNMIGNGYDCRPKICSDNPCFPGTTCHNILSEIHETEIYQCGKCPTVDDVKLVGDGQICVSPGVPCIETKYGLICENNTPPCTKLVEKKYFDKKQRKFVKELESQSCNDTTSENSHPHPEDVNYFDEDFNIETNISDQDFVSYDNYGSGLSALDFEFGDVQKDVIGININDAHLGCKELDPCYPGVTCKDMKNGYKCGKCPNFMKGNGLKTNCTTITCSDSPCSDNAICINLSSKQPSGRKFECSCPKGWSGEAYSLSTILHNQNKKVDEISSYIPCQDNRIWCDIDQPCRVNQFCVDDPVHGAECKLCPEFFESPGGGTKTCTDSRIFCESKDRQLCGSHEKCVNNKYGYQCVLKTCKDKPCDPTAICVDKDNLDGFICQCSLGWTYNPIDNTCVDKRVWCSDLPCPRDHKCIDDEQQGAVCQPCPAYFTSHSGLDCVDERVFCNTTITDKKTGLIQQGPCHPSVECQDLSWGAWCGKCPLGLTGDGKFCVDERTHCDSNPCYPGVDCFDIWDELSFHGFKCDACPKYFEGDAIGPEGCTDTRLHCDLLNCFENNCVEKDAGAECAPCPTGFVGNGIGPDGCIDPRYHCDDPYFTCFQDNCFETEDGAECKPCPQYYEGDGVECTDIRVHCDNFPCYEGVKCIELESGAMCGSCPEYFKGNGFECEDARVHCEDINCWGNLRCHETDSGAESVFQRKTRFFTSRKIER